MGASTTITGNWTWSDESSFSYNNFAPNQNKTGTLCAYLNVKDGTWRTNKDCSSLLSCICEFIPSQNNTINNLIH
uniref:C-type lectin domain-containing protein n=1 Tax=Acrobeloides nanus TaxID=290746 RepID=A0A914E6K5_9BILA